MSLTRTLIKIGIGYAAAHGVRKISRGQGLASLFKGNGQGGTGGLAGMMRGFQNRHALPTQSAPEGKREDVRGLLDQFNDKPATDEDEQVASLMLRAMIQSAKSDGVIDDDEKTQIMETLDDDADNADIAFVKSQLKAPVDIDALAADTPVDLREQVYSMSLMAIEVDTPAEARYLNDLAQALMLDQTTVNALHYDMGVDPLYS
ncbi:DUF533 domain-containing protein [Parasulfitobacter algicola]|uniref:Tellurite resistance TerB family protein n=1 Tax=Parasulfitobacter algicola TaxID=2614809 RepID=A0ABX2IV21_9RHOB|nr:DUF533 domain-containing protein [Sulfitobacter algicola]NSX56385.1 tellurite resistance TerB family protein [Sulfitobacter algicola]